MKRYVPRSRMDVLLFMLGLNLLNRQRVTAEAQLTELLAMLCDPGTTVVHVGRLS